MQNGGFVPQGLETGHDVLEGDSSSYMYVTFSRISSLISVHVPAYRLVGARLHSDRDRVLHKALVKNRAIPENQPSCLKCLLTQRLEMQRK